MKELMLFEYTMRLFFGDKAYGTASLANSLKEKKKWIKKVAEKMRETIDTIETTEKHKQNLIHCIEALIKNIDDNKVISNDIVFYLIRFCGQLLGFAPGTGGIHRNVLYYQDEDQHYASVQLEGGNSDLERHHDKRNIISARAKLVVQLKTEGFSTFQIAKILNITEYQVKQLKSLAPPDET